MDEKQLNNHPESENDENILVEEEQTDEKAPSEEELAAVEKMNNIFKSVSQVKQDTEKKAEEKKNEKTEEDVPEIKESIDAEIGEIELMTVTIPTTSEKKEKERKEREETLKKEREFAKKVVLAILVVALVILGGYFYADFMPGNQSQEVVITIPKGTGTAQIAELLEKDGLINSKFFYRVMSKLSGTDGKYNFGKFSISKGAGYREIFDTLTHSGKNINAVKITIPEGYEIYKIADMLEQKGLIDKDKFYYLIDYGEFDYDFIDELPLRDNRLEGYLFPSTYEFAPNDEYGIINEMLMQFDKMYKKYEERAKEMNMTMDEVVTLASIVEREAKGDEDRKLVSSVFHNRLKSNEMPYLQSCATVQYVLRERKPVLSVDDTKIDSPYNTYINKGLPIGPIASPGEKAVEATLYPANTDYLFFVVGADGKHQFSKTFGEHIQNKNG
ncbi:MAG: endolytic transglycosylase MltG [Clostridia bacterium]|nr:endolytic transglycosylase MltG [Clostridia bacterium]